MPSPDVSAQTAAFASHRVNFSSAPASLPVRSITTGRSGRSNYSHGARPDPIRAVAAAILPSNSNPGQPIVIQPTDTGNPGTTNGAGSFGGITPDAGIPTTVTVSNANTSYTPVSHAVGLTATLTPTTPPVNAGNVVFTVTNAAGTPIGTARPPFPTAGPSLPSRFLPANRREPTPSRRTTPTPTASTGAAAAPAHLPSPLPDLFK